MCIKHHTHCSVQSVTERGGTSPSLCKCVAQFDGLSNLEQYTRTDQGLDDRGHPSRVGSSFGHWGCGQPSIWHSHSGTKKTYDWTVIQLVDLFYTTHTEVKTLFCHYRSSTCVIQPVPLPSESGESPGGKCHPITMMHSEDDSLSHLVWFHLQ